VEAWSYGTADRVLGRARTTLENEPDELGWLVADGQRRYAHADIAIVNPGSIRNSLRAGPITYSDLFDVHAYEHRLVRMKLRVWSSTACPTSGT
jgi:5'-nucleotidase